MLLYNLGVLDICSPLIDWIPNFLIGRVISVSVLVIRSSFFDVRTGVPQGTVLGPLLFLLFVNYLPTYIISKCKLFADDLKIYLKIRHSNIINVSSDLYSCQKDIDTIVHVASSWGLQLNAEKYCVVRSTRK